MAGALVYLYLSAPALWCYSVVECIKRYLLSQARFLLACSHPPPYRRLATCLAQRAPRAARRNRHQHLCTRLRCYSVMK